MCWNIDFQKRAHACSTASDPSTTTRPNLTVSSSTSPPWTPGSCVRCACSSCLLLRRFRSTLTRRTMRRQQSRDPRASRRNLAVPSSARSEGCVVRVLALCGSLPPLRTCPTTPHSLRPPLVHAPPRSCKSRTQLLGIVLHFVRTLSNKTSFRLLCCLHGCAVCDVCHPPVEQTPWRGGCGQPCLALFGHVPLRFALIQPRTRVASPWPGMVGLGQWRTSAHRACTLCGTVAAVVLLPSGEPSHMRALRITILIRAVVACS